MEVSGQLLATCSFTPEERASDTNWVAGSVDHGADVDYSDKKQSS
jgi:hypothetical protein